MKMGFTTRVGLILIGILLVVGVVSLVAGWGQLGEIGYALILGGVAAMMLGALLGPSESRGSYQRANPFLVDRISQRQEDDAVRAMRSQGPGLYAWLAAGGLAIVLGVILRLF